MTKLIPENIEGAIADNKIIKKLNDNTFAEATASDLTNLGVSTGQYLGTLSYTAPSGTINNTIVVGTIPVGTKFAVVKSTSTANAGFYAGSVVIYTQGITEDTLQYRPYIAGGGNGWLTVRFNGTNFEIVAHTNAIQVGTIDAYFYG